MTSQKYFEEAWKNRKLVGGALKAAHVRPDYHLYEDLLQEGVILYAEMLRKLDGQKVRSEIDKLSFKRFFGKQSMLCAESNAYVNAILQLTRLMT